MSMIAMSEGTAKAPDPYRVCFGFKHTIADLSDHPAVTGEWRGEPLSDDMCIAAGFSPGCVSSAAGRYQINKPTWLPLKALLHLPNFEGDSQDYACMQIIEQCGALDLVNAGRIAEAIPKCKGKWASLPGSKSGQRQTLFADLIRSYADAGGSFA
jgi:lysozyme